MATITQLPSGRWRAQIRRKNLGRHEAVFDTHAAALSWSNEHESRLLANALRDRAPVGGKTFLEVVALYRESAVFLDKSAGTQRRESNCARNTLAAFANHTLASISSVAIQQYLDERSKQTTRLKKRVSADTVRLEKAFLSAVFRFAVRSGYATENPARGDIALPRRYNREQRITLDEQIKLHRVAVDYVENSSRANKCLPVWLMFIFETGTRPGEAAKIELAWFDSKNRRIAIPRDSHKTRRPRLILLCEVLSDMLDVQAELARAAGSKFLFWSVEYKTKELVAYRYAKPWRAICKRAGLPANLVAHSVRHEVISRYFEHTTLSDSQIAALVGDVHVLSLEPYKHLRSDALRVYYENHQSEMTALFLAASEQLPKK